MYITAFELSSVYDQKMGENKKNVIFIIMLVKYIF